MTKFFSSLNVRLLSIVSLALLPALLLILYSGFEQREKAVAASVASSGRLIQRIAEEQEKLFQDTTKILATLSLFPEIDPTKAETCNGLLNQIFSHFPESYISFAAFTPAGDVFCSAPPAKKKINIADRPHYLAAVSTGKVAFGQYSISRLTNKGKPAVYVAQPVFGATGELRALLNIGMSLDHMANSMENLINTRLPPGASATLFDAQGTVLVTYPQRAELVGQPMPEKAIAEAAFNAHDFTSTRLTNSDGRAMLYGYAPLSVNTSRAYVAVSIPMASVVAEANATLMRNLFLLGLAAIVALFVTWWATRVFALRHIKVLVDAARQLGEGDMSTRVDLAGGADELNTLAVTFNVMAERLRVSLGEKEAVMTDLRDLNRDLEGKVRKRTAEIERSEAQVRAVLENIAEGVVVLASEDRMESANPMAEAMFGVEEGGLNGMDFHEVFALDQHPRLNRVLGRLVDAPDGAEPGVMEFTARRHDGTAFPVELIVSDMPIASGTQKVCVMRDISRRKQAEAQLAEIQRKLLDAAHQSGMAEIATGVLHNIGNVLNSVCLTAEEIDRAVKQSKVGHLDKANTLLQENSHRLAEFLTVDEKGRKLGDFYRQISDLLHAEHQTVMSEITSLLEKTQMMRDIISTQQDYARCSHLVEDMNVTQLIEDAIKVEAAALFRHGVSVEKHFRSLPLCRVHKTKLLQVLTNLIKNAKEATEHNDALNRSKHVAIETGLYDARHAYVRVEDNGVGILPENLTRIFNHGFTTKTKGHGFGLHASINAVREMQGELRAESAGANAGATFTLILPLADDTLLAQGSGI